MDIQASFCATPLIEVSLLGEVCLYVEGMLVKWFTFAMEVWEDLGIALVCGLFTARWVLQTLGAVDQGPYGVVGCLSVFLI